MSLAQNLSKVHERRTMELTNAQDILDYLVKIGKVKEGDIIEAVVARPSNILKRTTDIVHTFCCTLDHTDACQYYEEEELEDTWVSWRHIQWLDIVMDLMRDAGIETEKEFELSLRNVIDTMTSKNESFHKLLNLITKLNPEAFAPTTSPSTSACWKVDSGEILE